MFHLEKSVQEQRQPLAPECRPKMLYERVSTSVLSQPVSQVLCIRFRTGTININSEAIKAALDMLVVLILIVSV